MIDEVRNDCFTGKINRSSYKILQMNWLHFELCKFLSRHYFLISAYLILLKRGNVILLKLKALLDECFIKIRVKVKNFNKSIVLVTNFWFTKTSLTGF